MFVNILVVGRVKCTKVLWLQSQIQVDSSIFFSTTTATTTATGYKDIALA